MSLTSKRIRNQHFSTFSRKTYSIALVGKLTQYHELSHITILRKYISPLVTGLYCFLLLDKEKLRWFFFFFFRSFKIRIEFKLVIKGETFIILNPSYNYKVIHIHWKSSHLTWDSYSAVMCISSGYLRPL